MPSKFKPLSSMSLVAAMLAVSVFGCQEPAKSLKNGPAELNKSDTASALPEPPADIDLSADFSGLETEPDQITVQHCLIGFRGTLPGKNVTRSKEEAARLAAQILTAARDGEDFGQLISTYTDDSPPGIYKMANSGVQANMGQGIYSRNGMVPAFGNVGFKLKVDGFGMSEFDSRTSPYGWHVIKRIK